MLRLFSELKAPGRAWLQIEVKADVSGSLIRLTSIFDPVGLAGLLYWYVLFIPFMSLCSEECCGVSQKQSAAVSPCKNEFLHL